MKYEDHPLFKRPPLIGYQGICKNRDVGMILKDDAVDYAIHKLGYEKRPLAEVDTTLKNEFENMLIDWFYSGDWVEVREGEEHGW